MSDNNDHTSHLPTPDDDQTFAMPSTSVGQNIGPYRLLEILGEGGMGTVYLAEQTKPIKRQVALKVIKLGMDTKEVVARFESERQALARMNHPNIAKVHDAGSTDKGRPYFVMEYVKGIPITDYCDQHRLDTKARLNLFISVCQAVHHAHQKGIIHRDLKPQNVLVEVRDGESVAKVIDFGVAKAMDHSLTDMTLFTQHGRVIGTPAYMSPEQAEMSVLDIDTTTDVFSLGVMLYELLSGVLPLDPEELKAAGWQGIQSKIREHQPKRLGTQLSALGDEATILAEKRGTTVARLAKECSNELDWITLRAMEKDRTRRYQSASEFAADIKRFLNNEPVLAHRPNLPYLMHKLIIRHKFQFSVALVMILMLVGFAATTTIQAGRIARERDRANVEAQMAKQVSKFMVGLFEVSDPSENRGNTVTAREILKTGMLRINEGLEDQPLVKARLMGVLGEVYIGLGLNREAETLISEALEIGVALEDDDELGFAEFLTLQGKLDFALGNYKECLENYKKALNIIERNLEPQDIGVAEALVYVGEGYHCNGDGENARAYYERSLAIQEKHYHGDHPDMVLVLESMGSVLSKLNDYEAAVPYFKRALAITEKTYGHEHAKTANTLSLWAYGMLKRKDFEGAREKYNVTIAIQEKVLGMNHPELAKSRGQLAYALYNLGLWKEAEEQYELALVVMEQVYGVDYYRTRNTMKNLAYVKAELGDVVGSELLIERLGDLKVK